VEAWLSAKGRTLAVFQLLRLADDHVMLVLAGGDAIASQLQRFVFRRKVKVLVRSDWRRLAFHRAEAASGAAIAQTTGDGWELDLGSDALPRTLRIGSADAFAAAMKPMRPLRLAPGRPALRPAAAGRRPARSVDPSSWAWTA
jgi:folate-binding Fe-S cluster repair protein YgfZ